MQRAALREVQLLQSLRHPNILLLMGLALQPAALVTGACAAPLPPLPPPVAAASVLQRWAMHSGCLCACVVMMMAAVCARCMLHLLAEYCSRGSLHDLLHAARSSPDLAAELSWPQRLACLIDAAKASGGGRQQWLQHSSRMEGCSEL